MRQNAYLLMFGMDSDLWAGIQLKLGSRLELDFVKTASDFRNELSRRTPSVVIIDLRENFELACFQAIQARRLSSKVRIFGISNELPENFEAKLILHYRYSNDQLRLELEPDDPLNLSELLLNL